MSTLQPGDRFGPYRLHEHLAQGGMAEIWHVTGPDDKPYALRRILPQYRFNLTARRRFFAGCKVLAAIHSHEFVIGYATHGTLKGYPYLLMEYVEATNLKRLLLNQDPVLQDSLGNILIDSATALEHVHESGFLHLDFKPENILVTRNGNVRLVDFDLALPYTEKPHKLKKVPGTEAYMAPEQLEREAFDQRADIWAYGVTAYEVLTGKKPFPGENGREIRQKQRERTKYFSPPREWNEAIPPNLEKIILRCLESDPNRRYAIMNVVVKELERALYVKD